MTTPRYASTATLRAADCCTTGATMSSSASCCSAGAISLMRTPSIQLYVIAESNVAGTTNSGSSSVGVTELDPSGDDDWVSGALRVFTSLGRAHYARA